MEICFETKEKSVYREYSRQSRRIQESAEAVVPDTDADIEKIAAVQSSVFLKSKDLSSRGVLISGELTASVIYVCEGREGLSCLRLRKPFSIEYELDNLESECLAQVTLLLQGTDVRVVNPRKVSVTFDIEGDLSGYCTERLCAEAQLPEDAAPGLHIRTEERTLTLPNAVCEKSVAINEQFIFSADLPAPSRLAMEKAELLVSDCQLIGSKAIVKGSAEIKVCGLADGVEEPIVATFSTPFSQIVDVGTECFSYCTVRPEISASYFDLVDTINGEKALDMELHAVLQIVCSERQNVRMITDAYSNLMPAELLCEPITYEYAAAPQKLQIKASEKVSLTEACSDLLCVFSSVVRLSKEADRLSAGVNLDFLYRNAEGQLSSVRRTLSLSGETENAELRILNARITELGARPDGDSADCSITLEILCQSCEKADLKTADRIVLNEEAAYVQESLPTLTLVRAEGESLWALAKRYHSSEEKIREFNEDAEKSDRMLMIPKCI